MDFEGTIREMSEKGDAAACVPAALKDAGLPVPPSLFVEAAISRGMDVIKTAEKLGFSPIQVEGLDLQQLNKRLLELKAQGLHPLIKIGIPTQLGVISMHVNSVNEALMVDGVPGFKLGGIPPFGKDKGSKFSIDELNHVVPEDGIILLKRTEI